MPETETSFQLKYCRTCASELVTGGVNIFGEEGKRLRISEKIRKTLSVLVLEEDLLPKRICTDCCTSLEDFSQYKEAVVDAQEKLKGISKSIAGKDSNVPSTSNLVENLFCKECGKKFTTHGGLEAHQKDEHGPVAGDDAVECVDMVCNDDFHHGDVEIEEVVVETSEPPTLEKFPCEFCDSVFTTQNTYSSHVALSHKGKRFQCSFCHHSYAQKASLTVHVRTHHTQDTPPKTHKCSLCSTEFYGQKALTRHTKTHVPDRQFRCHICCKNYKTSKCLSKHASTHFSENKFVCRVCGKGFSKRSRLAEHENTHSSTGALGCPFCPKTFNNYPNYLKHLRAMHEERWIAGQKAPPPMKNNQTDPPILPNAPIETANSHPLPSTMGLSSTWTGNESSPSKQNFHNVTTLELMDSTIQSGVIATTDEGGNSGRGIVQTHDPNQPMELSYKLSTSDFQIQDMPMELTKVFQDSGPLELCVRTDPETELSQLIDLTSANPKEASNFTGTFQQQPMDLINRECCNSMNCSMDLSLRSSFSDQSTSSFIRELLDLSSRSEYHHESSHNQNMPLELNLSSSKQGQIQPHRGGPHPTHNFLNVYSDTLFSLTNQN